MESTQSKCNDSIVGNVQGNLMWKVRKVNVMIVMWEHVRKSICGSPG